MPKTDTPAATTPALPDLAEITSVEASALPASTKRASLSDAEIAVADAIIAATTGDNAAHSAVGPKLADRKAASAAAARMKRLVLARFKTNGTPIAEIPDVKSSIVPKDGGHAWAVKLVAATVAEDAATDETENPLIPATGDTPAE